MFDVVVIGASSAGLFAAELLAKGGKKVAVFECQKEINPARRTLIVTPEIRRMLDPLSPLVALHSIRLMALNAGEVCTEVRLLDPDPIVERNGLATLLCSRARTAGAKIFPGYRFTGFVENGRYPEVRLKKGQHEKRFPVLEAVIGGDGVFSRVGGAVGIARPPAVPIVQAEVVLPKDWNPEVTQVWFDVEETRFFYWLIPEGQGRGVLGLVGDHGRQTRELLKYFLIKQGLHAESYQGSQVALHSPRLRPWGRVGAVPVYLVGDAAGQVKVTTVGGTVTGLRRAQAAARAVLNGTSYRRELRSLKRELDLHWCIRTLLDRLDNLGY